MAHAPLESNEVQRIEGIPEGYRLKRIGQLKAGEMFLAQSGVIYKAKTDAFGHNYVILDYDNVYGKDLKEVTIPAGYELAGESVTEWFRVPVVGDEYISRDNMGVGHFGLPEKLGYHTIGPDHRRIILRVIKTKTRKVLVIEVEDPTKDLLDSQMPSGAKYGFNGLRFWRVEEREIK